MTYAKPNEESIYLSRFKNGDTKAFVYFFEHYWEELYTVAYKHIQDEALSKDIVQELFIHIWERRDLINADYPTLRPYLFKSLKHKILNHYATEKVRNQVLDQLMHRMERFTHLDKNAAARYLQLEKIVDSSISKLPKLVKTVYLMRNDNCSIKQIAQALNIAEQTVKNYLSDAKRMLEKDLTKRFAETDLILIFLTSSFLVHNYLT